MRKILIVIFLISTGAIINATLKNENDSFSGKIQYALNNNYRSEYNLGEAISNVMIIIGAIFTIIGFISLFMRKNNDSGGEISKKVENLFNKAARCYEQKKYTESIAILNQILAIDNNNAKVLFNLACCYSLIQSNEAFIMLTKAIKYGYNDFDKINTYNSLSWLRSQKQFTLFVKNGYKISTEELDSKDNSKDIIEKLERLSRLKNEGVISLEEFENQKQRILR